MNEVNQMVKETLLAYPTLYNDRFSVLCAFFSSSNYRWTDDGKLVRDYPLSRDTASMDFSDLDNREKDLCDKETQGSLSEMDLFRRYKLARDRSARQLLADNIDLVAAYSGVGDRELSYSDLLHMNLNSVCLGGYYLGGAPFGNIDPAWLKAAEEFIDEVLVAYNRVFGLHHDNPTRGESAPEPSMFSQMPVHFQKKYTEIMEISDKLDAQSGRKARMKRFLESKTFTDLMASIKEDDDDAEI